MCKLYFKIGALDTSESLPTAQTGSLNVSSVPLEGEEDFLQGGGHHTILLQGSSRSFGDAASGNRCRFQNADSRQPEPLKPPRKETAAWVGFEIISVIQKQKIFSQMGLPKALRNF